jgi:hypothetical protein
MSSSLATSKPPNDRVSGKFRFPQRSRRILNDSAGTLEFPRTIEIKNDRNNQTLSKIAVV